MIETSPDELRKHRTRIHNKLVHFAMFNAFAFSAMAFVGSLIAPLYGPLHSALIRSAILMSIGTCMALLGCHLTRYRRPEN